MAMVRMFRMMMAMGLRVVLAGVLMMLVRMARMTVREMAVMSGLVMIASLVVGVGFPVVLGSSFMMESRFVMMVVFRHGG